MKISVLCSTRDHPAWPELERWVARQSRQHQVELVDRPGALSGGDLLFLVSCQEIVGGDLRSRYRQTLVVHASDLPEGRGWSPLVWQILEGRDRIAVTLLEAADEVDAGPILGQRWLVFEGHELVDEINASLIEAELALLDLAVAQFGFLAPRAQDEGRASWYRRRRPEDSRLDPGKTLGEQFDLLRVCDPQRYPAFFEHRGHRYRLRIEKDDHE